MTIKQEKKEEKKTEAKKDKEYLGNRKSKDKKPKILRYEQTNQNKLYTEIYGKTNIIYSGHP